MHQFEGGHKEDPVAPLDESLADGAEQMGLTPAILNLEYGYRYRRKGANLSDINCFRVEEIEMSEKLSFDWFIAKIHEVFDRLPDYRKLVPIYAIR